MRSPSRTRGSRYGQLLIDSMPPATAMSMSPARDALIGEHHRLEPRAAHLVDRERGHVVGEAAASAACRAGFWPSAGRDDVAHDAFVDDRRIDAGAADGFGDDQRAELRRGEVLERAEELAGRRADGADDDGSSHGRVMLLDVRRGCRWRCRRRRRVAEQRLRGAREDDSATSALDSRAPTAALVVSTSSDAAFEPDARRALDRRPDGGRHANVDLAGDSGAPRSSSTSAPGRATAAWQQLHSNRTANLIRLILSFVRCASSSPPRRRGAPSCCARPASRSTCWPSTTSTSASRPARTPGGVRAAAGAEKSARAMDVGAPAAPERAPASAPSGRRQLVVLGADTAVVVDGDDPRQAARRRGRGARCCGAVRPRARGADRRQPADRPARELGCVETTTVVFAPLTRRRDRLVRRQRGRARQGGRLRHPGAGVALRPADRGLVLERGRAADRGDG